MGSGSIRVLHVDDEPDFADLAATYLERTDGRFDVEIATTAREGLDRLTDADEQFDCVVSDHDMPGMDGIDFLDTVREDHPELPFILFTGKGSEEVASEAISAGVTDYLQKETGSDQYTVLANRIRNAVDRLRANRERQRQLDAIETAQEGISILDEDGEFIYVNEAYAEHYGYDPDEMLGEHWELIYPDGETERVREEILPEVRRTGSWNGITTGLRADGSTFVEDHRIALTDRDELICTVRDASDRHEHERELRNERTFIEQALDTLDDVFYVIGTDGALRRWNEQLSEVTGYPDDELAGMQATDLFPEDERATIADAIEETLTTGETVVEAEILTRDGERPLYELTGGRLTNSDGELVGLIGIGRDITERKETERELRARSTAMEASIDGLAILDQNEEYSFVNQSHATIYGYDDPEAFLGETWRMCYDDDEIARFEDEVVPTLFEAGSWRGEAIGLRKDGSTFPQELSLTVTEDERIICVVRDITERKAHEQRIEDLHDTAQMVLQAESDEAVARIVVEAIEDILGMPINGIWFHDEDAAVLRPVAWTERATEVFGEPPTFDAGEGLAWEVFETGDGSHYDDVSTVSGRLNPDTRVRSEIILPVGDHGVITIGSVEPGVFDDIDVALAQTVAAHTKTALDRIEREATLRAERETIERLFETSPVGITIVAPDGTILRANGHAEEVLGLTRSEITDRTYDDPAWGIIDEDGNPIPSEDLPFRRVFETGEPVFGYAHGIEWPDGTRRWLSINASPLTSEDGEIEAIIAVTKDVTHRREQERRIRSQNERLEKFASVVSHDLRNPLNVAEGRLELAREEFDSTDLDAAADAVERSLTLIDHLLTLAREGEPISDLEAVNLAEAAERCWLNVETKDATLVIDTDRAILADASRLKQLLENLFGNAVDHGGEDVTVVVDDLAHGDGFYVADDGPGIPADERERVFEPGYSRTAEGTGFGLNIVAEIVEAHGWEIRVTDSDDGGARFEITGVDITD